MKQKRENIGVGGVAVVNRVVRKGLSGKVTFD